MGFFQPRTIRYASANARENSKNSRVDNRLKSILNLFFPQFCVNCRTLGFEICPACLKKTYAETIDFPLCLVCENLCIDGELHKICKRTSPISRYLFGYMYRGITKRIIQLKSKNPHLLKTLLKSTENSKILNKLQKIDLIIPIPPSPKHFSPRILEPAEIVSGYLQLYTNIPVYKALYKPPTAKQQKLLNISQRQNPNIRLKREAIPLIRNRKVLLVDDLCTSGSTLNTSAKLLRRFGARDVAAYTLARDLKY